MNSIYVVGNNILSPLGFTTALNIEKIKQGISGITLINDKQKYNSEVWVSQIDIEKLNDCFSEKGDIKKYTRLERMLILSVSEALKNISINIEKEDTLLIVSSTKGNIDILDKSSEEQFPEERINLWAMADEICRYFHFVNNALVISTACTSGVSAIIIGARLIETGRYKNVIVCGGDILSEFVVSGFGSLHALSDGPCKPFDKRRTGLSLGEASGTIILSSDKTYISDQTPVRYIGSATGNDANHISAPSRDGLGLAGVILQTIDESKKHGINSFDFISAHGTATRYNDETEGLAINHCGLGCIPVNSLKGFWGHTLGAAGIIETIASIVSIREKILFECRGYEEIGVSTPLNIITKTGQADVNSILKICSGFGGMNAAAAFTGLV